MADNCCSQRDDIRNVNPLFQTANVGFYATAIISFVHLAKVDYVLAHKEMPQPAVSEGEEQRQRKRHHNPHDNLQRQSNFYIVTERIVSGVHYESVGRGREW